MADGTLRSKTSVFIVHCVFLCFVLFKGAMMATTERSVHRRVERGVREAHVTPLTVPVSVHLDGNYQRVTQVCLNSL